MPQLGVGWRWGLRAHSKPVRFWIGFDECDTSKSYDLIISFSCSLVFPPPLMSFIALCDKLHLLGIDLVSLSVSLMIYIIIVTDFSMFPHRLKLIVRKVNER